MSKTIAASALGMCMLVFLALSFAAQTPAFAQSGTATPIPTLAGQTCQNIVNHALTVLQNTCNAVGRNNACYGNASIQAQLASADFSFQNPGDVVPVKVIKTVSTSPLNQDTGTWGLSLFKLQANLPDTLPGQNVTFLVFGNTTVQNVSGDMSAFYFSTGLGAPSCAAVPTDSILVRSPDHTQVTFTANGVTVKIASTVRLTAIRNQSMTVQLIEGHATVSTPKGARVLQPSQSVSVALGGATGLQAQGIPAPATESDVDARTLRLVSSLNTLTNSNVSIPIKGCVTAINPDDVVVGDVPIQMTSDEVASKDLNVGDCTTVNANVQTDSSGNVIVTPSDGSQSADTSNTGDSGSGGTTSGNTVADCPPNNPPGGLAAQPPDGPGPKPAGNPPGGGPGKPPDGPGPKAGGPPGGPGPANAGCVNGKPAGDPGKKAGGKKGGPPGGKPSGGKPPGGKPPAGKPPGGGPPDGGPGGKKGGKPGGGPGKH